MSEKLRGARNVPLTTSRSESFNQTNKQSRRPVPHSTTSMRSTGAALATTSAPTSVSSVSPRATGRSRRHVATRAHDDDDDDETSAPFSSRRRAVFGASASASAMFCAFGARASVDDAQRRLGEAYARQDFSSALDALGELRALEPGLKWTEATATVLVDAKRFDEALKYYSVAIDACEGDPSALARVYAGRALALEGEYKFAEALSDYNQVLRLCEEGGFAPDPYVLNSRGNAYGSLGDWSKAKDDYALAAELFQNAKGFRNGASTTQRLDGAIYAFSNLALAEVELGNEEKALSMFESLERRSPNSADVRVAVAVLLNDNGRYEDAEDAWFRACNRESGCAKYKDLDYVRRIRRWPPSMVKKLEKFLSMR